MQQQRLESELKTLIGKWGDREENLHEEMKPLLKVAEDFAAASVGTFTGELLDKALAVSKAIAEFTLSFDLHAAERDD